MWLGNLDKSFSVCVCVWTIIMLIYVTLWVPALYLSKINALQEKKKQALNLGREIRSSHSHEKAFEFTTTLLLLLLITYMICKLLLFQFNIISQSSHLKQDDYTAVFL